MNKEWHEQHRLGRTASAEERLEWHLAHAQACTCRELTPAFLAELRRKAELARAKSAAG